MEIFFNASASPEPLHPAPCAENDKINELDEPYFGTHILSNSLPSQTFEIPKKNTQPLISTRGLGCSGHQKSESFKTEL